MEECLFCKIVKNEVQTRKVYDGAAALAFLDINPSSYGHTVVIPKKHYKSLTEMPADEAGKLFEAVAKIAAKVRNVTVADGFNMGINDGQAAGQVINHVHIHIIPRWKNDGGGAMQSIARAHVPKEKMDEIEGKIKSALAEKDTGSGWSY